MSGWRILARDLHAAGGGPLPAARFDRSGLYMHSALKDAVAHGLIVNGGGKGTSSWTLTAAGLDFAEGRASVHRIDKRLAVIRETPTDAEIAAMLAGAGHELGQPLTLDAARSFSRALVAMTLGARGESRQAEAPGWGLCSAGFGAQDIGHA